MKKMIAIILGVGCVGIFAFAQAAQLTDAQMGGITAGQVDTIIADEVFVESSAVLDQKNVAAVASLAGGVSNTAVSNVNTGSLLNFGNSAVGMQANIAAISGLGEAADNLDNSIEQGNIIDVNNEVASPGSVDGTSEASTNSLGAGTNSLMTSVSALNSAVAVQTNIAAMVGNADVSGTSINNYNQATVTNTVAVLPE